LSQTLTTFPLGQSPIEPEMSLGPTSTQFKLGWVSECGDGFWFKEG